PCKDLNSIEPLEVVNFYIAASRLINNRLAELLKVLGISGFEESEIVAFSLYSSHRLALATCNRAKGRIQVAFKTILAIESLDLVLIHELCHLVHDNHTSKFWNFFEFNIKKLGLISTEYDGWNSRFNKYDETWDNDFAYDVEHFKFKGSCDRRVALLKYILFEKSYHAGLLLFRNEIHNCGSEFFRAYGLCAERYHLYCNGLIIKNGT
ncbi:M48 family metallopeptidase, partial [uncultured Muribaculum sp.]